MFSMTTTEFVTKIPTDVENPVSVSILSVKPNEFKKIKVDIMEIGIESATMNVLLRSCKNKSKINPVSKIPSQIVVMVSLTVALVKALSSRITFKPASGGKSSRKSGRSLCTSSAMLTTLPSELFVMEMRTILSLSCPVAALKYMLR